jgi:LuxR family quorum sensing-dependent transcriptional regulator
MNGVPDTHPIVAALADASTTGAVARLFHDAIAKHGFNASACGCFHITRRGAVPQFYFQDWPEDWLTRYVAENFVNHDFGVAEARTRFAPFAWSEAKAARVLTAGEKRIWQAVLDHGWNDGFSVPVHGPGGYFGLVTMAGTGGAPQGHLRQHLHLIALAAHERCRQLAGDAAIAPPGEVLTSRELECLRWVAAGASDTVIAGHLGISANTAKEYVNNARRKLGASTRAQAVAMLFAQRLL